jgi:hypothetical protein
MYLAPNCIRQRDRVGLYTTFVTDPGSVKV